METWVLRPSQNTDVCVQTMQRVNVFPTIWSTVSSHLGRFIAQEILESNS